MIVSYADTIMADNLLVRNVVKVYRQQRGWSQAELARRAVISRTAVSAIEMDRLVPSVAAALSLAAAFGCAVEDLFGLTAAAPAAPAWAWSPPQTPCRFWIARVRERNLHYPAEATAAGVVGHDGVFQDGTFVPTGEANPETTLVVACCDPAASLLAAEYARSTGFRLIAVQRSSRQALTLLAQGVIHAAGLHFATEDDPDGNVRAVRETVGEGFHLLRVARWQEGLSVSPGSAVSTVGGALRGKLRWVGREPGSAARQCLDRLLPNRPPPKKLAHDHRGVADGQTTEITMTPQQVSQQHDDVLLVAQVGGQQVGQGKAVNLARIEISSNGVLSRINAANTPTGMGERIPPRVLTPYQLKYVGPATQKRFTLKILNQSNKNGWVSFKSAFRDKYYKYVLGQTPADYPGNVYSSNLRGDWQTAKPEADQPLGVNAGKLQLAVFRDGEEDNDAKALVVSQGFSVVAIPNRVEMSSPALERAALNRPLSLHQEHLVKRVLADIDKAASDPGVQLVLDYLKRRNTPQASAILETLAQGAKTSRLGKQAQELLQQSRR
jgi:DNA-binding XRE family transcriptional regulator/molybdate-binding protein